MSNFSPDKSQQGALLSWYKEGNELRMNPRHPLIALAEEAGELAGCFKKHNFKPNFNWWNCKKCGKYYPIDKLTQRVYTFKLCECNPEDRNPLIVDELGDFSYYLRILAYQQEIRFDTLCDAFEPFTTSLEELLNDLVYRSARLWKKYLKFSIVDKMELQIITFIFLTILEMLEVSLEQVLELNYKKLNSEETQHGWNSAR